MSKNKNLGRPAPVKKAPHPPEEQSRAMGEETKEREKIRDEILNSTRMLAKVLKKQYERYFLDEDWISRAKLDDWVDHMITRLIAILMIYSEYQPDFENIRRNVDMLTLKVIRPREESE